MINLVRAAILASLAALHITTTTNGAAVDLQGKANPGVKQMKAFINAGASTGTSETCDVKVQESDASGSGFTDISGATFTQLTDVGAEEIHFQTIKRYVRLVATLAGTSPTFDLYGGFVAEKRAA